MKTLLAFLTTALILLTAPAMAGEQPYNAATLQRMLAAGQPVVVDFHADWCPTCRAQAPIVKDLLSTPELKNVTVLIANYDTEHALRKSLNVANQSTLRRVPPGQGSRTLDRGYQPRGSRGTIQESPLLTHRGDSFP